jgi:hypothetical protein
MGNAPARTIERIKKKKEKQDAKIRAKQANDANGTAAQATDCDQG